jgi:hypothetical protein
MEQVGIGTELKINVHIDPMGDLHMSDYNFTARFYTRALKPVVVNKEDMIEVDSDNYIALVDTKTMTAGVIMMVVTCDIPDSDFADGLRYEVSAPINTGIQIVK